MLITLNISYSVELFFYLEQFYIAQLSFQQFSRAYHINTEVSRASSH